MTTRPPIPRDPTFGGILKECSQCQRFRDTEDLYASVDSDVCLLCKRRPEVLARQNAEQSAIRRRTLDLRQLKAEKKATPALALTKSDRRKQLIADGKFPDEVARIIAQEFPS